MDYRRYRELGLPIGSGTVESACKNVVAARMKQSGMMWGMLGATGICNSAHPSRAAASAAITSACSPFHLHSSLNAWLLRSVDPSR